MKDKDIQGVKDMIKECSPIVIDCPKCGHKTLASHYDCVPISKDTVAWGNLCYGCGGLFSSQACLTEIKIKKNS